MLLTRDNLLDRLHLNLKRSERVDIAVAWAADCDALNSILVFGRKRPGRLRAIVGIAGNATHPNALQALLGQQALRIASSATLFHPKLYLFHQPDKTIAWVGSANLTRSGFQQNEELVFEFSDDGSAEGWFDKLWPKLDEDCSATVQAYSSAWKPPPPPPRPINGKKSPTDMALLGSPMRLSDWNSYVRKLSRLNAYWEKEVGCTIDGEVRSWLNTITLGRAVVRRPDWSELSREDYRLILGRGDGDGYGLLGSMKGTGYANEVFNRSTPEIIRIRRNIRAELQTAIDASDTDFAAAAGEFISAMEKHKGFGGAIATRLLALARPDRAVSVNNGSRDRLAEISGLPKTSLANSPKGRAKSYVDLLRWFERKEWYASPTPRNPYEKVLAGARAALFDAFVFDRA